MLRTSTGTGFGSRRTPKPSSSDWRRGDGSGSAAGGGCAIPVRERSASAQLLRRWPAAWAARRAAVPTPAWTSGPRPERTRSVRAGRMHVRGDGVATTARATAAHRSAAAGCRPQADVPPANAQRFRRLKAAAVAVFRALAELPRRDQRDARAVQQLGEELEAALLRLELEQLLLRLRLELDLRGELEGELRRALVDLLRLGIGQRGERRGTSRPPSPRSPGRSRSPRRPRARRAPSGTRGPGSAARPGSDRLPRRGCSGVRPRSGRSPR